MSLLHVKHPLIEHKLGVMRSHNVDTKTFRTLANEVASLLSYEATKDLVLESIEIIGWNGKVKVQQIKGKKITVVPILRAGIGMLDGVLNMIPNAKVSVIGLYRNEKTLQPVSYFERLVDCIDQRMALILDPMLATGGSMCAAIKMLKDAGCRKIRCLVLVAAPEGIKKVTTEHPDVDIFTAAVDDRLNPQGYILPGLGDAGDKIFGTK